MKLTASFLVLVTLTTSAAAFPLTRRQHEHHAGYGTPPAPAPSSGSTSPSAVCRAQITPGKDQCEYSLFEKFNMGHNHDVNTGKIKAGTSIAAAAPALAGSLCSPAWAVGGEVNDETRIRTPDCMKLSFWGGVY